MKNAYHAAQFQGHNNGRNTHFGQETSIVSQYAKDKWKLPMAFLNAKEREMFKVYLKALLDPYFKRVDEISTDLQRMKRKVNQNYEKIASYDKKVNDLFLRLDKFTAKVRAQFMEHQKKVAELNKYYMALEKGVITKIAFEAKVKQISQKMAFDTARLDTELKKHYMEFSKYPVLVQAFRAEVEKQFKKVFQAHDNFTNELNSNLAMATKSYNKANQLSDDFSNHIEDNKSFVKSVRANESDFKETVQVVDDLSDDFQNHMTNYNVLDADFREHVVDYSLHKKPASVIKKELQAKKYKKPTIGTYFYKEEIEAAIRAKKARQMAKKGITQGNGKVVVTSGTSIPDSKMVAVQKKKVNLMQMFRNFLKGGNAKAVASQRSALFAGGHSGWEPVAQRKRNQAQMISRSPNITGQKTGIAKMSNMGHGNKNDLGEW